MIVGCIRLKNIKLGFKLLLFIVVIISILTVSISYVQAATIAGGKYFHGQNFTSSIGGQFKIYGMDSYKVYNNDTGSMELRYRRIVVMSNIDDTVSIANDTCEMTTKYNYCYKGSSINYNDERTFQDGYMQSVMELTIESLPPSSTVITFTRNSSISAYCGEIITVPIIVTNGGTVVTNISYTEMLPINTVVIDSTNGILNENIITFKDRILANSTKTYSYKMLNLDCQTKKWVANYSFTTLNNSVISKNITNLNMTAKTAYYVNETLSINKTNNPSNFTIYTWNITNNHTSIDLLVNISIHIPNVIVIDKSLGITSIGDVYQYVGILPVGQSLSLFLKFNETNFGDYTIQNIGTLSINDHVMEYNSSNILHVLPPNVIVYMDVNNTVNKSTTVSVWARNDDITSKYYYLYGTLKGIGDEEPLNYNVIEPDTLVLVAQKVYNTTGLGIQNVNFVFDGVYRDKDNIDHKLHTENLVTINVPDSIKLNSSTAINTSVNIPKINGINSTTDNSITKSTTSAIGNNTSTNVVSDSSSATAADGKKKDVVTRAIEALSEFLQAIFG